jgi:predicted transposase/invertase (TIGR01784 family)
LKQFAVFNIQLPYFPDVPEDYSNTFYRWCKLLYEMHFNKKSPKEVSKMQPRMKKFIENDAGAAQFVARYDEAAASPVIQRAYWDWFIDEFRERSMLQGARSEGLEEGLDKGRKEGLKEGLDKGHDKGFDEATLLFAKKLLKRNRPIEEIIEDTGLSHEIIEALRAEM